MEIYRLEAEIDKDPFTSHCDMVPISDFHKTRDKVEELFLHYKALTHFELRREIQEILGKESGLPEVKGIEIKSYKLED